MGGALTDFSSECINVWHQIVAQTNVTRKGDNQVKYSFSPQQIFDHLHDSFSSFMPHLSPHVEKCDLAIVCQHHGTHAL